MKETDLNRKLAKWAGFVYDEGAEYMGGGGNNNILLYGLWYPPDNDEVGSPGLPDFTQSLDACFEWLVLEARRRVNEQQFVQMMHDWLCAFLDGQDPAPALCGVISKLIRGG